MIIADILQNTSRAQEHGRRQQPRYCKHPGCKNATREFKPLCTDHIDVMSYAAQLIAKQKEIEAEISRVNARGEKAIPKNSIIIQELIKLLSFENFVLGKIYRHVSSENFTYETSKIYISYMERHGYICLTPTATGRSHTVELANKLGSTKHLRKKSKQTLHH